MTTFDATPDSRDLWEGIGGHFDSLTQVLAEFIDNSAANFDGRQTPLKQVFVTLAELDAESVHVSVEDTGTGIQDLGVAFRLGDRSLQDSPLSAHGFGIKHALATADPQNASWRLATRTSDDHAQGTFREVHAPYSFSMDVAIEPTAAWPGQHNGPGTFIEFSCSRRLFDSITLGVQGHQGFERTIQYLAEDLGFMYADIMTAGLLQLSVNGDPVPAILPTWEDSYDPPGQGEVDHSFACLGGRTVGLSYHFGEMRVSAPSLRRYQRNIRESGVEIRLNGRMIEHGLLSEVWGIEKHGDYNHFLAKINLESDDIHDLPQTRASKNGFREGDPVLGELFEWIRNVMPNPPKELTSKTTERRLVQRLMAITKSVLAAPDAVVTDEKRVFASTGSPPRADMYVYDGHSVTVYEAKKDTATVQDLYQLLLYWDGLVDDGLKPARGVLVASDFSQGVDRVLHELNQRPDSQGNPYVLETTTWRDRQVEYPPALGSAVT